MIKSTICSIALLCGSLSVAVAHDDHRRWDPPRDPGHCMDAPELDTSTLVSALAVLGAGLVLVRGRKVSS